MTQQKKKTYLTLVVLAILGTVYHFVWDGGTEGEEIENLGLAAGGTSAASSDDVAPTTDPMSRIEIPFRLEDTAADIVEHMGYTISYNQDYRVSNWVAYELLASEVYTGYRAREDSFEPDPLIKGRQAYDSDYVGSGYDRGHMAPAGDMKWSSQAMKESFYLSNVCPQNHNLNAGAWNDLEKQIRYEAKYYGSVYVTCGPIFNSSRPDHIGSNHVMVPDSFFKAILTKTKDGSYAAVGFIFPNETCTRNLTLYAMSVDELEQKLGMDFFFNLDPKIQEKAEASFDLYKDWRIKDEVLRD